MIPSILSFYLIGLSNTSQDTHHYQMIVDSVPSNNPKGRVPRALPVGECEGGDMVCLEHGNPSIWAWSLPNGVPRCMDPEISPPYPESWSARLLEKTFPESHEEFAGV